MLRKHSTIRPIHQVQTEHNDNCKQSIMANIRLSIVGESTFESTLKNISQRPLDTWRKHNTIMTIALSDRLACFIFRFQSALFIDCYRFGQLNVDMFLLQVSSSTCQLLKCWYSRFDSLLEAVTIGHTILVALLSAFECACIRAVSRSVTWYFSLKGQNMNNYCSFYMILSSERPYCRTKVCRKRRAWLN